MPDMAVSGFVVNRQYVRMDAPGDSAFAGFWAEVRQNLTNGERKTLIDTLQDLNDREQRQRDALASEIAEMQATIAERKAANTPADKAFTQSVAVLMGKVDAIADATQREAMALVIPHIRAWNAVEMDGDDVTPIPPPMEGGMASIDAITSEMGDWLCGALLIAYRSGKGVRTSSRKRDGSPPQQGGPKRGKRGANGASDSLPSLSTSASPTPLTFQA